MKRTICLIACLFLIASCPGMTALAEGFTYGAWLPYWEQDTSLKEMDALGNRLETAVAFACIFDNQDQPLMLSDTVSLLSKLRDSCAKTGTAVFLSIVNDVEIAENTYDNKSTDLLKRLFADDESMTRHLEALTKLMDDYCLTGLELDYENLKSDTALWAGYTAFIKRLWTLCERDGVRLRVVLPWDAPKYATLPNGPEYTVMCYNLYGYHSGPGPKADLDFLKTTCDLYQAVSPRVRMAFATGGFDWHDGTITDLTQQEAETQLAGAGVTATRDSNSGVLTAVYPESGSTHELWYADAQTLAIWRDACAQSGYASFDLFRLGGNNLNDWDHALFGTQP